MIKKKFLILVYGLTIELVKDWSAFKVAIRGNYHLRGEEEHNDIYSAKYGICENVPFEQIFRVFKWYFVWELLCSNGSKYWMFYILCNFVSGAKILPHKLALLEWNKGSGLILKKISIANLHICLGGIHKGRPPKIGTFWPPPPLSPYDVIVTVKLTSMTSLLL